MKRIIIFGLLAVLLAAGLVVLRMRISYRQKVESTLNIIQNHPALAWTEVQRLLSANSIPLIRSPDQTLADLRSVLIGRCLTLLSLQPPTADAYRLIVPTMGVLDRIQREERSANPAFERGGAARDKRRIINAIRKSAAALREDGTMGVWREMLSACNQIRRYGEVPEDVLPQFDAWLKQQDLQANPTLGARGTARQVEATLNVALTQMGVVEKTRGDRLFIAMPDQMTDNDEFEALGTLSQGLPAVVVGRWEDDGSLTPTALDQLIQIQMGTIELGHLVRKKDTARRLGSTLIAAVTVSPRQASIPPPATLFDRYCETLDRQFDQLEANIRATLQPPGDRDVLLALITHNRLVLARALGQPSTLLDARFKALEAALSGPFAERFRTALAAHPDTVLLLTGLPESMAPVPLDPPEPPFYAL